MAFGIDDAVTAASTLVTDAINKIWPDPADKAKAEAITMQAASDAALAQMKQSMSIMLAEAHSTASDGGGAFIGDVRDLERNIEAYRFELASQNDEDAERFEALYASNVKDWRKLPVANPRAHSRLNAWPQALGEQP